MPLSPHSPLFYLRFLFVVKDDVLGTRGRWRKRGILRQFGVTFHNTCSREPRSCQEVSPSAGRTHPWGDLPRTAHHSRLEPRAFGAAPASSDPKMSFFMQELLPQPQQHPVLVKSSSKSTRAAKPPVSFQHQPVPACNPLEKITPPPHSDHQQSPLPSQEPRRALTLFLQHLVGLQDLHLMRQPQRPAVHQLQDLGLHFLWCPAAEILEESRGGLKLI